MTGYLKKNDPQLYNLIQQEAKRQTDGLEMIPSENYTSAAVRECNGSILTNKYSEGYPRKRYYNGNEFIDEIEILARERAKKLFGVPFVNVQPYSGSPANFAVYVAVCNPGDTVLGLDLTHGGHLTHGWIQASAHSTLRNMARTGRCLITLILLQSGLRQRTSFAHGFTTQCFGACS